MQIELKQTSNTVNPHLQKAIAGFKNKRPFLLAMGEVMVQHTKRAFTSGEYRPAKWAPKKDGSPARLRKSGALARSPRITQVSQSAVWVGTDRRYAVYHQLGTRHLPARPFFPLHNNQWHRGFSRTVNSVLARKVQDLLK